MRLPRNQLFVTRVTARTQLADLLHTVCSEKDLEPSHYEFRHPGKQTAPPARLRRAFPRELPRRRALPDDEKSTKIENRRACVGREERPSVLWVSIERVFPERHISRHVRFLDREGAAYRAFRSPIESAPPAYFYLSLSLSIPCFPRCAALSSFDCARERATGGPLERAGRPAVYATLRPVDRRAPRRAVVPLPTSLVSPVYSPSVSCAVRAMLSPRLMNSGA